MTRSPLEQPGGTMAPWRADSRLSMSQEILKISLYDILSQMRFINIAITTRAIDSRSGGVLNARSMRCDGRWY